MKARIIDNNNINNLPKEKTEKEALEALVNFMGAFDGGKNDLEFQAVKKEIMESGITSDQLWELMTSNAIEEITGRQFINVSIQKLTDTAICPTYSHPSDGCADIYADEEVTIAPGKTHAVSTGIALAIPNGFVAHVYPRSGLSMKTGLRLANSIGIIDAGYRDELKILLWNTSKKPFHIESGMRIAQIDIMPSPALDFVEVDDVKEIAGDRLGGFGSSGLFDMIDKSSEEVQNTILTEMELFNGKV